MYVADGKISYSIVCVYTTSFLTVYLLMDTQVTAIS